MCRRLYGNETPQVRNYAKRSEDQKIGSDFEKKKIGSKNRIGHFFEIVPSLPIRSGPSRDCMLNVEMPLYLPSRQ